MAQFAPAQPVLREWSGETLRDRIDLIWQQIYKSIRDPITRSFMMQFLREYRTEDGQQGCPERDDMCDISAIFYGFKNRYRYTHDIRDVDTFLGIRRQFILGGGSADGDLSKGGVFVGDCDDAVIALVSLLTHAGFRAGAKVIGPKREFVHIYAWVEVPRTPKPGVTPKKIYLDATVRSSVVGWEPPARFRGVERVFAYAEKH